MPQVRRCSSAVCVFVNVDTAVELSGEVSGIDLVNVAISKNQ